MNVKVKYLLTQHVINAPASGRELVSKRILEILYGLIFLNWCCNQLLQFFSMEKKLLFFGCSVKLDFSTSVINYVFSSEKIGDVY